MSSSPIENVPSEHLDPTNQTIFFLDISKYAYTELFEKYETDKFVLYTEIIIYNVCFAAFTEHCNSTQQNQAKPVKKKTFFRNTFALLYTVSQKNISHPCDISNNFSYTISPIINHMEAKINVTNNIRISYLLILQSSVVRDRMHFVHSNAEFLLSIFIA